MVDRVVFVFAVLAMVAAVFVVAVVVAGAGRLVGRPGLSRALGSGALRWGPWAGLAVAGVATVGSLWLSGSLPLVGGAGFVPCRLCWFQRVAMYPLVVVFTVGGWFRDRLVFVYASLLAAAGLSVSGWHVLVERFPTLEGSSCDPFNPCSLRWVEVFGVVTIPMMAACGFAAVLALAVAARWGRLDERLAVGAGR